VRPVRVDEGVWIVLEVDAEPKSTRPTGAASDGAPAGCPHAHAAGDRNADALAQVTHWVRTFLMQPHPALGRTGDVCPFTAQSGRLDLLRIQVCEADASQAPRILQTMEDAVRTFDAMECRKELRVFRTVIVGFPNCTDEAGLRVLKQTQDRLTRHSFRSGKMIGFFHKDANDEGLINPDFRPMRSPIPLLAIRMMVEQDAPFVVRNPSLTPVYLYKWPRALPRLLAAMKRKK
jgi:hypothetical protein